MVTNHREEGTGWEPSFVGLSTLSIAATICWNLVPHTGYAMSSEMHQAVLNVLSSFSFPSVFMLAGYAQSGSSRLQASQISSFKTPGSLFLAVLVWAGILFAVNLARFVTRSEPSFDLLYASSYLRLACPIIVILLMLGACRLIGNKIETLPQKQFWPIGSAIFFCALAFALDAGHVLTLSSEIPAYPAYFFVGFLLRKYPHSSLTDGLICGVAFAAGIAFAFHRRADLQGIAAVPFNGVETAALLVAASYALPALAKPVDDVLQWISAMSSFVILALAAIAIPLLLALRKVGLENAPLACFFVVALTVIGCGIIAEISKRWTFLAKLGTRTPLVGTQD